MSFIAKIKTNDEQSNTTKENTIKILHNIYELRKKKVLLYIAYKKQLPQSIPKLDMGLYNQIFEVYSKAKLEFDLERNNFIVLQHIPKIILPSGAQIGPLEKDDTVLINDEEDKKFLLNNNICKNI
ncbi:MAG: hypothetical protein ACP5MZ_02385 [Candidatus Micrarchaeia archaeon]